MSRPIDHIVLPCADLAQAATRFERLGFQVSARNRHPWGTENHVIQFPGAFLELIALAPDYTPLPHEHEAFPFAGFLAGQSSTSDPSAMLVLRSHDARADAASLAEKGIGTARMLHFARSAKAPDGGSREVAFSLAFAEASTMPDLGFFLCQQHRPEHFWNPAFQRHPNGVTHLQGVMIRAESPAAHAEFFRAFADQPDLCESQTGFRCETGGGFIEVLTPAGLSARLPMVDAAAGRPRLAALMFAAVQAESMAEPMIERVHRAGMRACKSSTGWVALADPFKDPALVFEFA